MRQRNQDEVRKLVSERGEAESRLETLLEESLRTGMIFGQLAEMLKHQPAKISFENVPMALEFQGPSMTRFKQADIDPQRIQGLVRDIQDAMLTLDRLEAEAHRVGIGG